MDKLIIIFKVLSLTHQCKSDQGIFSFKNNSLLPHNVNYQIFTRHPETL